MLGAVPGGLIGYEREWREQDAGLRTLMLVCLGTAFVVAAAEQARMPFTFISRIILGIMAGIGFVGASAVIGTVFELHVLALIPESRRSP